jgi:flagellar biosynthetic protein FliQ
MNETDVIQITRDAITLLIIVASPLMIIGMLVGLGISLIQALTQIQESTISFVPKIIIMFLSLMFLLPFMTQQMIEYGQRIGPMIVQVGGNTAE